MPSLRDTLRAYRSRQHVRPYAIAVPILVILVALPLLRPLRHPTAGHQETQILATLQSFVHESGSGHTHLSGEPAAAPISARPVFPLILAGLYWAIHPLGLRFSTNPLLLTYILTVLSTTLPAALAAGLVYRMGRTFELPRPWRTALGGAAVFATGLFAYSTALNPQVLSAVSVLWSSASLLHISVSARPARTGGWIILTGLLAALATVLEPAAASFLFLLPLVILAMRWTFSLRVAGVILYGIGALPPLLLHFVLVTPDPAATVQNVLLETKQYLLHPPLAAVESTSQPDDLDERVEPSPVAVAISSGLSALLGTHGVLSHYPILLLGGWSVLLVMHRHWPSPTKMLAAVTLIASCLILLAYAEAPFEPGEASYASRWAVVFAPSLMFWAGAWLRRKHHPATYGFVGALLGFSVAVSILGATNPFPPAGHSTYTPLSATRYLLHPGSYRP